MMYLETSSKLKSVRKAEDSVLFWGETLLTRERDSGRSGGTKAMRLDARELSEGTGDAAPEIGPPLDVIKPSGTWYAISVPLVSSNRA